MEYKNEKQQLKDITLDLLDKAKAKSGDLFVLGCSSSEIIGEKIGTHTSEETGEWVINTLLTILEEKKIDLAVQGCEHINRALVVDESVAKSKQLPVVSVVPALQAGGAAATAAYKQMKNPVVVEHITAELGLDIGDTSIGMHIRHVQIPIRTDIKSIGSAHVSALGSRPKLIGGARAIYTN